MYFLHLFLFLYGQKSDIFLFQLSWPFYLLYKSLIQPKHWILKQFIVFTTVSWNPNIIFQTRCLSWMFITCYFLCYSRITFHFLRFIRRFLFLSIHKYCSYNHNWIVSWVPTTLCGNNCIMWEQLCD